MFKMFPHVEAFWKNARMAEIAELATQKAKEAMMKEQNNTSILEEIKEEENDFENKRGKTLFLNDLHFHNYRIYLFHHE